MNAVSFSVNGRAIEATVEPRTHLADFLRERAFLTGTRLGCEHGVCGACTLLIDGVPARSCITFAVACQGASITTIEGLDEDSVAHALRAAFSREHALQCGYCTAGMMMTARDIVMRLPDADERRVREELSGNLCRCTGYVGLVRAVLAVLDERRRAGVAATPAVAAALGPAGAGHPTAVGGVVPSLASASVATPKSQSELAPAIETDDTKPTIRIAQSFTVPHPRAAVWATLSDVVAMAACLPGAVVTGPERDGRIIGEMRMRLGPIAAAFAGQATIQRDPAIFTGVLRGGGDDPRGGSRARGEVRYALIETGGGRGTTVNIELAAALTGPLAQFGRSGLVDDVARRLTAVFAQNLGARLSDVGGGAAPAPISELNAGSLVFGAFWTRVRARIHALFGRG